MVDSIGIDVVLILLLLVISVGTVITIRLLHAAVGLALVSALLTIVMYRMGSPVAAVFELSVCAGLILVIFISTISLTQRLTPDRIIHVERETLRRFWFLPIIIVVIAVFLSQVNLPVGDAAAPIAQAPPSPMGVREVLWNLRHMDLIGQVIILLAGAFGVLILFKRGK